MAFDAVLLEDRYDLRLNVAGAGDQREAHCIAKANESKNVQRHRKATFGGRIERP
jgi:hypothetical protein